VATFQVYSYSLNGNGRRALQGLNKEPLSAKQQLSELKDLENARVGAERSKEAIRESRLFRSACGKVT
jgi:hypothetical protein